MCRYSSPIGSVTPPSSRRSRRAQGRRDGVLVGIRGRHAPRGQAAGPRERVRRDRPDVARRRCAEEVVGRKGFMADSARGTISFSSRCRAAQVLTAEWFGSEMAPKLGVVSRNVALALDGISAVASAEIETR